MKIYKEEEGGSKKELSYFLSYNERKVEIINLKYGLKDESSLYSNCTYMYEKQGIVFDDIKKYSILEFPKSLFLSNVESIEKDEWEYGFSLYRNSTEFAVEVSVSFDVEKWTRDINLRNFCPFVLKKLKKSACFTRLKFECDENTYFYITGKYEVDDEKQSIESCVLSISKLLDLYVEEALEKYHFKGFFSKFNFQGEYKHVFAKYLTYFGEFLEDLGINGKFSVVSEGNNVILNFEPKDKHEVIENIEFALRTFLALPDNPEIIKPNEDFISQVKYQQLLATVDHLKGSLRLAHALVDVKEQELCLLKNNQSISASLIHAQSDTSSVDKWELIEGVEISKYKGKFFEIDLPKLAKKLGFNK